MLVRLRHAVRAGAFIFRINGATMERQRRSKQILTSFILHKSTIKSQKRKGERMTNVNHTGAAGWNLANSYAGLPEVFFTKAKPTQVENAQLVVFNSPLAETLGLKAEELQSDEGIDWLAGSKIPEGAEPLAQAYAGHQFGHFTMLGDGRAVLIGEQITPQGKRFDIQLKGSGRTPFSRGGDGLAPLGPMLREYIISEAMHGLGIPTSRSLAVTATGETVIRESEQPGGVLTRVSSSHLRVGTFQYAANWGSKEDLQILADYALDRHFPGSENTDNPYLFLLQQVIEHQAELIAQWQLAGFIHGVMNTDNMTISGETIDYGPCAFMDNYDPKTVFSSIDVQGRYAYGHQPGIAVWNLARFAETLLPLIHDDEDQAVQLAEDALSNFAKVYHFQWAAGMRAKLGIFKEEEQDEPLIENLLDIMEKQKADYTNTFRALTRDRPQDTGMTGTVTFDQWLKQWQAKLERQEESKEQSLQLMHTANPAIIPRNHRVEEALEAAVEKGDYSVMEKLLEVLKDPYAYTAEQDEFAVPPEPSQQPYRTFCGT